MGIVVGRSTSYIECNDPHGIGCRKRTAEYYEFAAMARDVTRDGWRPNHDTGAWYCNRCYTLLSPLRLTRMNWWQELGNSGLPTELIGLLRDLISSTLYHTIGPTAFIHLINLAKQHLSGGLIIDGIFFEILVVVANDALTHRDIFVMVPSYPSGRIKRLDEFV